MTTKLYTLSKDERLSWKRHIDLLFQEGKSFVAFPLRIIYYVVEKEMPAQTAILISIPKKKIKRAVQRNHIKRQVREAFRVRKPDLNSLLEEKNKFIQIAFLYMDKEAHSFQAIEKAMDKTLHLLQDKIK
jgi:ribonuclease P protein component